MIFSRIIPTLLLLSFLSIAMKGQTQTDRKTINLNREWRFKLGDHKGAEQKLFDDSQWDYVGLPHSFSLPYFLSPDIYIGYGWYRKTVSIPKEYIGKQLSIEFEAAFQDAEIFMNGKKVGSHKGGYTGFPVDVTNAVVEGENILAVRLNNLWNPRLAPRAGGYIFSGGIYRDVHLVVTNPIHVSWYGTFITTPQVSTKSAIINITTEICNSSKISKDVNLKTEIYDPTGKLVTTLQSVKNITAGKAISFSQTSKEISNPQLWHPDHPYLYKAVSLIYDGKRLADKYETTFGIRKVEWTADKGFFINGEHYYIKGANVHQDHAGWADGVTNAGYYRDVKLMKDAGFNFIRGSHYPHDPSFSEACDKLGILLWQENVLWGIGGYKEDGYWNASAYPPNIEDRQEFESSVKQQLTEMIRIHRNHPSIVIWSMCNEAFFTAPETLAPLSNLLKESVELSHRLDPSRLAAIGGAQRPLGEKRIDKIGDVAGYNGDGSNIPAFQNPGIPTLVSEYGSINTDRPGDYDAGWGDMEKQHDEKTTPWRSGQAIWSGFDYGCFAGSFLEKMGIVDYFRIPKRSWYWYRNEYKKIPPPQWAEPGTPAKIRLTADKTTGIKTDGTDDIWLHITILDANNKPVSNSPAVTLNIISGPGEFPTGHSIVFEKDSDIKILEGEAAIDFRSYYAGETIIRATSLELEPAEIKISFEGNVPYIKGKTPEVKNRPYVIYGKDNKVKTPQLFGPNNPSFASSVDPLHATGFAGDGDLKTWWQPLVTDNNPFWILDTEKGLDILNIKIQFPDAAIYKYCVEVSDDKINWKTILDNLSNNKPEVINEFKVNKITGRFVRISFKDSGTLPKLAEVEVTGIVID